MLSRLAAMGTECETPGVWRGWMLINHPCTACPHPVRQVASFAACSAICQQLWHRGCTSWLYNSMGDCYIKGGAPSWQPEHFTFNGTTWAGVACHNGTAEACDRSKGAGRGFKIFTSAPVPAAERQSRA